MLSLIRKRKIPTSEDVLTAAFFGSFRLFVEVKTLATILSLASRRGTALVVPEFDTYEIELWPAHRSGEPDVRVILRKAGSVVARLLVEAKLGAEKSGLGPISADRSEGDQLARYLLAETEDHPTEAVSLIYLTHHACWPRAEMEASELELRAASREDLIERLFWMSWRDAEACLSELAHKLPWTDLRAVLRHVSMFRFRGLRLDGLGALDGDWAYPRRRRVARVYPRMMQRLVLSTTTWQYAGRSSQRSYQWPVIARPNVEPTFYKRRSRE